MTLSELWMPSSMTRKPLSDTHKVVFFLLTVKCPLIAADIGAPVGALVVKRTRSGERGRRVLP